MATPLLDRRMLIVSGKGGVGRTTVVAALARAAQARGRRVLVAQMAAHERLGPLFGRGGVIGPRVTTIEPGLDAVNMTPREALHEYGILALRFEALFRTVFENRAVRGFLGAVPGLDAYAMLGKAWHHTTERERGRAKYDLVIVDAPASGHVTTLLRVPKAILDAMPKGPLSKDALAIRELLADETRAAFLTVTLAEELPARECSDLVRVVRDELHMPLGPLIVNAVPLPALGSPALRAVLDRLPVETGDSALDATLVGTRALASRRRDAETVLERLAVDPGLPIIELPRFPATQLGPGEVAQLADRLKAV